METKRLIPYSVHLPEDVYLKLKQAAGERKASALVRDAITLIVSGSTPYNSGYNNGIKDAIGGIEKGKTVCGLAINGDWLGILLTTKLEKLLIKEKANGKKNQRGH